MAFWNSEKIKDLGHRCELVKPFDEGRVKHGAYELSLGPEAFVTDSPEGTKQSLVHGQQLVIRPGQFGLLLTEETVFMPCDAIGFISIKASIKFAGLVNVSGFHVDPKFVGRLKFAVYNAGSQNVILARGEPVFPIWFNQMEATADGYNGVHKDQQEITSQDVVRMQGQVSSPSALRSAIDELRTEVEAVSQSLEERRSYWMQLRSSIVGAIVGAIVAVIITLSIQWVSNIMQTTKESPPGERQPNMQPREEALNSDDAIIAPLKE